VAGGWWMWSGVVFLFAVGVGGEILTKDLRDESNPVYRYPIIHDVIIYSVVAGHFLATFIVAWVCAAGDPFGFGAWANQAIAATGLSHDVFAARAANAWF